MQHAIAVCSQKGGVGKTTVSLNLALALAELGVPVTLVELDPQGSFAASLSSSKDMSKGLARVLFGQMELDEALQSTKVAGFNLLPIGDVDPDRSLDLEDRIAEDGSLDELLFQIQAETKSLVFWDCPAGFGGIVQAALRCATQALVPVQAEPLSLRSINRFLKGIESIRLRDNPKLNLLGLLLVMLEKHSEASLSVLTSAWAGLDPDVIFETVIPRRDDFLQASLHGIPIAYLSRGLHPEGQRFQVLTQEVLARLAGQAVEETDDDEAYRQLL